MKNLLRFIGWALGVTLILFSTSQAAGSPPPNEEAKADCSFRQPQLPGRCNMTVLVPRSSTPQQTCETVLRCLNDGACPDNKKYCNNPGLTRDWKLEDAEPSRPRVDCAYSNPAYSGWCRLTAPVPKGRTPTGACEAVLACMNGSPCEGFILHCGSPDGPILSGWRLEEVKSPQPGPTPRR